MGLQDLDAGERSVLVSVVLFVALAAAEAVVFLSMTTGALG